MDITQQLDLVYQLHAQLEYEIDDRRIVTVRRKQDHWIQRWARKLQIRIPAYRHTTLDDFASFVFLSIDGQKTVQRIGECVAEQYGEKANPLYERLLTFLNHIEKNEHYIVRKVAAD